MGILVLKLVLTPVLIAAASIVQRRWGPALGGWLVGLPLTSGPISVFFFVEHGSSFAAAAARGTLAGTISEAAFCLAYVACGSSTGWAIPLIAASAAFLGTTALLQLVTIPIAGWAGAVAVALLLTLRLLRTRHEEQNQVVPPPPPRWDIPVRALVATGFVLALTAAASALGPELSGLLSPFPIYAGVMIAFTQAHAGTAAARSTTQGVIAGLFAFAAFFVVVSATISRWPGAVTFIAAVLLALAVQGASIGLVRHPPGDSPHRRHPGGTTEGQ